jgi:uncharacterized protein YbbK (DUF523 family)
MTSKIEYIVSACLAGEKCRYDCQSKTNNKIVELVKNGQALALCPEQLGGLPTPRPAAEIQQDGKVITHQNIDITDSYELGAAEAWNLSKQYSIKKAYLKSKSPMCGFMNVYDGTFTGKITKRNGVFADLLNKLGIDIESVD